MRKANRISNYSLPLTFQAHFRFLCWCLCFKSVGVFCSCLIRAVFMSYWKTVPEDWSEERLLKCFWKHSLEIDGGRGCYSMSLHLCGLCSPFPYFCYLTVPSVSYCSNNASQNPLQPSGSKQHLFCHACVDWLGVCWSSRFGWAWIQAVGGFSCLSSSDQ